nr:unnamed protein product [Callosobruchus chinensis]
MSSVFAEKDINDAFEEILFAEEKAIKDAYETGFKEGATQGNTEGYHLGYHRGAELGAELGFYEGVVESCLESCDNSIAGSDRIQEELKCLKELLSSFPRENDETVDILTLAEEIRTKYKKVCARMKLNMQFPEKNTMSF